MAMINKDLVKRAIQKERFRMWSVMAAFSGLLLIAVVIIPRCIYTYAGRVIFAWFAGTVAVFFAYLTVAFARSLKRKLSESSLLTLLKRRVRSDRRFLRSLIRDERYPGKTNHPFLPLSKN